MITHLWQLLALVGGAGGVTVLLLHLATRGGDR